MWDGEMTRWNHGHLSISAVVYAQSYDNFLNSKLFVLP